MSEILEAIQKLTVLQGNHKEQILMLILYYSKSTKSTPEEIKQQLPIQFEDYLTNYIEEIDPDNVYQLSKAYNMMAHKFTIKMVQPKSYNLLLCHILKYIGLHYKNNGQTPLAIKTFKHILKIEQAFPEPTPIKIIQTRLSLTPLLSGIQQHSAALNQLNMVENLLKQCHGSSEVKKLECIMYYNMGVEWELLGQMTIAKQKMNNALELSQQNDFTDLQLKIQQVLQSQRK